MTGRIKNICLCLLFWGVIFRPGLSAAQDDQPQKGWQQLKGQDFIIYYRQDVPDDFVQTVMQSAEEEFKRVTDNLGITRYEGWTWDKRAKIYIFSDEEDYVRHGGPEWSHGAALVASKTIRTFPSAYGFFDSILPHELGHIILREYIGLDTYVPLWFEEGVAMYQEKAKRFGAGKVVEEAIKKGQFIPLSQLTDMRLYSNSDQQTVDLFYMESASVVYFLITNWDDQHFYNLLRELKDNTPFMEALKKIYWQIRNLDDLNKLWVNDLNGDSDDDSDQ